MATLDRQKSIWKKAKELNDTEMLLLIQGDGNECIDMVASDFQYHKLCLTQFLNRRVTCISGSGDVIPDTFTDSPASFQTGINWLISEVDEKLMNDACVFTVSCLRDMLCKWLQDNGGSESALKAAVNHRSIIRAFENHYTVIR